MSIDKVISVIIPLYNMEKYIERCISSICSQTYKNLEIIVVDDSSTDSSNAIVKELIQNDNRIKLIEHDVNRGLYHARLSGVEVAQGDYIAFVDSDDYISCDFLRTLIYKAESTKSDIVVGKAVHEDEKGYRYFHNLYNYYDFGILEQDDILKAYWKQEGKCFIWHTIWNKLYSREIWDKSLPILKKQDKHLIMTEDFVFSSVIMNNAKRLSSVDYGAYFYFQHSGASTSTKGGISKFEKNINDLKTAFDFVFDYISGNEYKIDVKKHYQKWSDLYLFFWMDNVKRSQLNEAEKNEMTDLLERYFENYGTKIDCPSYFYSVSTEYDNRYNEIMDLINSDQVKCVSFDIFDTAIFRPVYKPTDLFILLNDKFREIYKDEKRKFSDIRIRAEKELRDEKLYCRNSQTEDISLQEIYDKIDQMSFIPKEILVKLAEYESEIEIKLCKQRKSIYNIYKMALHCQKKISFTSDMYLDKSTIEKILKKNKYTKYDYLLISSNEKASKRTGKLYDVLLEKSGFEAKEIVHIGDNWDSDITKARDFNMNAIFYPAALDCIQYNISDIKSTHSCCPFSEPSGSMVNFEKAIGFLGTRSALAVAANKMFDNPFCSFNEWTEVNCSPQFLGYYALGMHLLGFTKWIMEKSSENQYNRILFVARDGYLPMKAFHIMKKYYKEVPSDRYFYTSRKAALICGVKKPADLFSLYDNINAHTCTPNEFLKMIDPILDQPDVAEFKKSGIALHKPFADYSEYCKFIKIIDKKFFNQKKCDQYHSKVSKYFSSFLSDRTVCVDIGYSGRTQEIMKDVTGKSVDAMYVHENDDNCSERERTGNFKVHSYYEHTPAITGGAREVLFSDCSPSCIGYDTKGNNVEPIFEDKENDYSVDYLINEIQRNAIEFVKDYCDSFGEYLDNMDMRNLDISYPYEYFLHTLTDADSKMFDCFEFEDDLWAGKTQRLSDYWKECIRYHKIIPFYMQGKERVEYIEKFVNTPYVEGDMEYKVYIKNGLDKKSIIKKAMYWYVVDRKFFKQRLKERKKRK